MLLAFPFSSPRDKNLRCSKLSLTQIHLGMYHNKAVGPYWSEGSLALARRDSMFLRFSDAFFFILKTFYYENFKHIGK